jgi:hypothetical protein
MIRPGGHEKEGPLRVALAAAPQRHRRVSGDRVGTGTARQLVRGSMATPARPDCVADHTCDEVWVILSSNIDGRAVSLLGYPLLAQSGPATSAP